MKTQKTIYHILVDKSGSMSDCIDQTINGYNEQITKIGEMQSEFPEQEMTIGLTTFNTHVDHLYFMQPVADAYKMNYENYMPADSTALLDAMGETIDKLTQLQEESLRVFPTTVVMVILTDGYENASREFSLAKIKSMVEEKEKTGTWTFSYLGATLDAMDIAEQMSIRRENSISFQKSEMQEGVWNRLNNSMRNYYDKKRTGEDIRKLF